MRRNAAAAVAEADTVAPPARRAERPRILLVDDEPRVVESLALQLRRRYDVLFRTSGADALGLLSGGEDVAAVVSDLRMPGMDGVRFLGELRRRSPSVARVLLTGHADVAAAIGAVNEAGVHRFLTKPSHPDDLARAIEEALDEARGDGARGDADLARIERLATLGSMAGAIGHEVGNLASALAGSLALVRDQAERGELPTFEDLGVMDMVRARMGEHAINLQSLARPRGVRVETVELAQAVGAVASLLGRSGVTRLARVELDLPSSPLYVRADRTSLEGVFINLLKNAAESLQSKVDDAVRRGVDVESPRIRVTVARRGGVAQVLVEDNGPGIPREVISRLFTPFFTTKGARGTGLGLAISKETLRRAGGDLSVESEPGAWTRFVVELPNAQPEDE